MKILISIALIFFLILKLPLYSQNVVRVQGEYQVRQEDNITRDEAKQKAAELAMINAIEKEFGTLVAQETNMRLKDNKVSYSIIGSTRVSGDWIGTLDKQFIIQCRPVNTNGVENVEVWITCRMEGKARKALPRPKLEVQTLNCPQTLCRTSIFKSGESLHISFKSPVDGYLSVFIDEGDTTRRLFPYGSMGTLSSFKVTGDREYVLFSDQKAPDYFSGYKSEEIHLVTNKEIENDLIYVVFSESEYYKPVLTQVKEIEGGYSLPKSMKTSVFTDWLGQNCEKLTDFQWLPIQISIEKD
jgi:hypothetical protein